MPRKPHDNAVLHLWEANSAFWDDTIGPDGNKYWQKLQQPCLQRLLGPTLQSEPNSVRALEFACGNGLCSRWLASHESVSQVIATDGSQGMLDRARKYGDCGGKISFHKIDVTSGGDMALEDLGVDIILINMALMDVSDLTPLAEAVAAQLHGDGVFVTTLLHPVFMTSKYTRNIQHSFDPSTGERVVERSKAIHEYLNVEPARSLIAPGQDTPTICYHRPIHELLAPFFQAGLVMDALEEPNWEEEEDVNPGSPESTFSFTQLPCLMAFRLRNREQC